MLRAIQEIQPRWVVGENVRGLISWNGGLVFHEVQADLEAAGYEVQPFLLPACGVNAPHRRDRIWFVAYANNKRGSSGLGQVQEKNGEIPEWNHNAKFSNTSNGVTTNAKNLDAMRLGKNNGNRKSFDTDKREGVWGELGDISGKRNATNSNSKRLERRIFESRENEFAVSKERKSVNSINNRSNTWDNFPTVSPVRNGDDGLSTQLDGITFHKWRNESIKAGGNAIVPQVALQIFKAIQAYEDGNS